jgi:hypothetical protein
MRKGIITSVCALLGLIAGYLAAPVASIWLIQSTEPDMFGAFTLFLAESFIACNPKNQPPSERVQELSKNLSLLPGWRDQNRGSRVLSQEIGLTYVRLSQLDQSLGNNAHADEDMRDGQDELTALGCVCRTPNGAGSHS